VARQFTQRKEKRWGNIGSTPVAMTANGTFIGLGIEPGNSVTFLRMLGGFLLTPTPGGTFAAGDQVKIVLAIGIMSADSFAVGASAMPDPAGDPDYPWLYWASHSAIFAGANPTGDELTVHVRERFDIRSMRKIKSRQTLGWVLQYVDISGTPPMTAVLEQTRVLIAET